MWGRRAPQGRISRCLGPEEWEQGLELEPEGQGKAMTSEGLQGLFFFFFQYNFDSFFTYH